MRAIIKKLCKLLAKQMPGHQFRVALLRWSGYVIGGQVFVGEDLIIVDEPSDRGMVRLGDRVAIAPRVTLVVSSNPNQSRTAPYAPVSYGPIDIKDDAWIGTGVVVLPGVTVGEGAVVGANSVVTTDVEPYTVVGGLPAKLIRRVHVPWIRGNEVQ